ncbi:uncharacterized protein PHACADRAFT_201687 [Phanerochaete carnosa HHB-10118-sp]|uniref:Uncharacterized protein n=1 Tax=Phanerochaete carnosa (strain HHB-10118-sp) TaxID=650164 RepID=K5WGU9_PHACS|nr:uncharacterized protein PHACADRAFT_201687 [Phanerochaete carnosa HHB-10118-sp]EKM49427.1 hypothetical protein PHACADRAFT_201687 [Phanerochaete carnosa HHB-10118-sp]
MLPLGTTEQFARRGRHNGALAPHRRVPECVLFLGAPNRHALVAALTSKRTHAVRLGSSTGMDVVASMLSFRASAKRSLLGDSCNSSLQEVEEEYGDAIELHDTERSHATVTQADYRHLGDYSRAGAVVPHATGGALSTSGLEEESEKEEEASELTSGSSDVLLLLSLSGPELMQLPPSDAKEECAHAT